MGPIKKAIYYMSNIKMCIAGVLYFRTKAITEHEQVSELLICMQINTSVSVKRKATGNERGPIIAIVMVNQLRLTISTVSSGLNGFTSYFTI